MRGYQLLIIAFIAVFFNEVTNGHPFQTRFRNIHKPLYRDTCSYTCDNLASLLALSRTLDEKDEPVKEVVTAPTLFNADELIMKLVNALVDATTSKAQQHCHCHCSNTDKSFAFGDSRYHGGHFKGDIRSTNSDDDSSNDGLLNLDLLNLNKKDNVLDLDLSKQHLLGVGLGGRNHDESSYASSSAYSNTHSNNPAISSSRTTSSTSSKNIHTNNVAPVKHGEKGNTNEDLVNVDVLNQNKDNNVAELALSGQNVLGVGLGGN